MTSARAMVASWVEGWFARPGKTVLRMTPERMVAPGHYVTLPTAAAEFDGAFAHDDDGTWVCQPDGAGGYEWDLLGAVVEPTYGYTVGPYMSFLSRQQPVYAGANFEWTNMPLASTELASDITFRKLVDLTDQTQYEFVANTIQAGSANAVLDVEYTTDLTGATGWTSMAGGTIAVSAANTWTKTGWVAVPSLAKAFVLLRVMGSGGNGAADPRWAEIAVQFRGTGVTGATGATGADGADGSGSLADTLMLAGM